MLILMFQCVGIKWCNDEKMKKNKLKGKKLKREKKKEAKEA